MLQRGGGVLSPIHWLKVSASAFGRPRPRAGSEWLESGDKRYETRPNPHGPLGVDLGRRKATTPVLNHRFSPLGFSWRVGHNWACVGLRSPFHEPRRRGAHQRWEKYVGDLQAPEERRWLRYQPRGEVVLECWNLRGQKVSEALQRGKEDNRRRRPSESEPDSVRWRALSGPRTSNLGPPGLGDPTMSGRPRDQGVDPTPGLGDTAKRDDSRPD